MLESDFITIKNANIIIKTVRIILVEIYRNSSLN